MKPKKNKIKLRLVVFGIFCFILNFAYADYANINYEGLKYELDIDAKTATCNGLADDSEGNGNLVIPDYVEYNGAKYAVTFIGDYAFTGCSGLTGSLVIPDTVIAIGRFAFDYCTGFSGTLTIGNSVTTIGYRAFQAAKFNDTLILGPSVTTISDLAFWATNFVKIISYNPIPPECGEEIFYNTRKTLYVPDESVELYKQANIWDSIENIYGLTYLEGPSSITVSPSSFEIEIGKGVQLSCEVDPQNSEWLITWISSDPEIATVTENGFVTAISPGIAIIYAQAENGVTGAALVTVVDKSVASVTIIPGNLTLEINETMQLAAQISPAIAESNITWSSLDTSVAVVNEEGLVTAVGKGATLIYATADNGVTGKASVMVLNSNEVSSVVIVPDNLEMIVGSEEQLEVIVKPSTTEAEITWLSSNPAVAEVSETGVVSALSPGLAIIYALSDNGVTGLATVRVVTNEVTSVIIEPDILTLELEETGQFRATIEPSVAETALIWSSNDPQVATIDEEGFVKATGAGFTVITATADNGVAGMAIVKVIDPNAEDSNPGMGYGDNGVYVSAIRIREGDMLGLFAERPIGYENNDWQYDWYLDGDLKAEGKNVMVAAGSASGWKGTTMEVSTEMYQVDITNLIGNEIILDLPEVKVYSRPLTPEELLRKGDGATRSFIAMSSLSDSELSRLGYSFVFGYNDADGVSHVISNSRLRYCHTTKEIYENPGNRFWVYTTWTFPDGATITSGLRYLDGSVNERFDRSDYNFTRSTNVEFLGVEDGIDIYTLEGMYAGKDLSKLAPGIYIIKEIKGNEVSTRKIIKR